MEPWLASQVSSWLSPGHQGSGVCSLVWLGWGANFQDYSAHVKPRHDHSQVEELRTRRIIKTIIMQSRSSGEKNSPGPSPGTPTTPPVRVSREARGIRIGFFWSHHVMSGIWRIRHPLQVKYLFLSPSSREDSVSPDIDKAPAVITNTDEGIHQTGQAQPW